MSEKKQIDVFVLTDKFVYDIINSLTIDYRIKNIIIKIILNYSDSFVEFIYSSLVNFGIYYINIYDNYDNNIYIDYNKAEEIENTIERLSCNNELEIDLKNIFIIDIYDLINYKHLYRSSRFQDDFYNYLHSRLEDIVGPYDANILYGEIFEAIDTIFDIIENSLLFNYDEPYIVVHFKLMANVLKIHILYPSNSVFDDADEDF